MVRRPRPAWVRALVTLVGVLLAYFAVPLEWSGTAAVPGVLITLLGAGLLGSAITSQVVRHVRDGVAVGLPTIAILLELVLAVFALGYLVLQKNDPDQFYDLETRLDSLYFTLQVLSTVGLGDVNAQGQAARALVSLQMAFDLVFVAAAGSLFVATLRERISRSTPRRGAGREE